jgi:serine/threonine protein kinase
LVEILDNKQYERSADIYSFGILLWVIMTQQRPYIEVMNSWDIAKMVLEGKRLAIPGSLPIAIKELIEACWDQLPNSRPTIDRVVQQLNLILSTRM